MAEKDEIIREKIDHSGIFDFKGFYRFAHGWLVEENFGVVEEKYSEKVSGNSRNISFKWMASKRLSDYFKIEIEIESEVDDLTDVEVEIDGERKKMNKGKIKGTIKGALLKDPGSKWDTTAFTRFMRDVYNKYIIPGRISSVEGTIRSDVTSFKEELKAFLELSGRRK